MRYDIVRQVVLRSSLAPVQPSRDDLVLSCLSVCHILGQFKDQHAFHLARPIVCLSRHDLGRVRAQQSMTAACPIHCRYSPCRRCWFLARNGMFVLWPTHGLLLVTRYRASWLVFGPRNAAERQNESESQRERQTNMIGLVVTWNVDILCPVAAIYMSVDSRRTANAVEGIETFDSSALT